MNDVFLVFYVLCFVLFYLIDSLHISVIYVCFFVYFFFNPFVILLMCDIGSMS